MIEPTAMKKTYRRLSTAIPRVIAAALIILGFGVPAAYG